MAQVNTRKRNGKWEYRFETASVAGKRKQKSKGGFRTKAEALKAGNEALNEYNNTGLTLKVDTQISVYDFFCLWFDEVIVPNRSNSTITGTQLIIRKHINGKFGEYRLSAVTHTLIQSFINEKSRVYSKSYMKRMLSVMHSAFDYAYTVKEIIGRNPASRVRIPSYAKDTSDRVRAYTIQECMHFAELLKGDISWYAFMIGFYTGMRIGEICALTWSDIDFKEMTININKTMIIRRSSEPGASVFAITPPKTKASVGRITFGDDLKLIFRDLELNQKNNTVYYGEYYYRNYLLPSGQIYTTPDILEDEMAFVLRLENGSVCKTTYLHDHMRKLAGLDLKFHNLRHTHATLLIESGVSIIEVQERLRHSSASTTLNTYAESTDKLRKESVHAIEKAWTDGGQNVKNNAI